MRASVVLFSLALICAGVCSAASKTRIRTEVKPTRAGVFIDGKYVGPVANFGDPRTYEVTPGEHEIKLVDPRYEDYVTKITVQQGKTAILKQSMTALPKPKPPFGHIRVESTDHFAAVYVNDHYMGHADEFSNPGQTLMLNPGTYEIRIEPINGAQVKKTITVEADKTVIVK